MQQIDIKRDLPAALQFFGGLVVLPLMLLGVGGTIYKLLASDGWLSRLLDHVLTDSLATISALLVMCGIAWLVREWRTPRTRSPFVDVLVYAFACIGLLYVSQLMVSGRL